MTPSRIKIGTCVVEVTAPLLRYVGAGHRVGPAEPCMDDSYISYIVSGLGLLFVGVAVARAIETVRGSFRHSKKTESDPILLDGWNLRPK